MCNAFLLFRLEESGLGSQDILSEKPWNLKKNMLESFLHEGKKADPQYFCETLGLTVLTDGLTDKVIRVKVKSSEGRDSFSNYTLSFKLQFNSLHQTC